MFKKIKDHAEDVVIIASFIMLPLPIALLITIGLSKLKRIKDDTQIGPEQMSE